MSQIYQVQPPEEAQNEIPATFLDNLKLNTVPIPVPGSGSVLVRIRAVALNHRDLYIMANSSIYPLRTKKGLVPCMDGAGEIVSTGPDSKWKDRVGEAVIVQPQTSWIDGDVSNFDMVSCLGAGDVDGLLAQHVVVADDWLAKAPKNCSFEEAASLPCAGATAFNILSSTDVGSGTTVVTQGTGGVSCFVIQFAAAMGARVISTSSSSEKLLIASKLGASELINYVTTPKWGDEVLRLTNGHGADLVTDVGGSATVEESIQALRQGGTACLVGFLGPAKMTDIIASLLYKGKTLKGIIAFSKTMVEKTVELVEHHNLHPRIKVFEWKDAHKAFEALKAGDFVGKIVIKV
ncbi:Alcohol dehydrogenase zinc-containing protein [Rutstroemia sp. NJR-2017a WRK4]|nr:Alcohol dehydrogenase zinc-containing protein [Rutstroemia sp. NJR-2017a WRK4]